MIRSISGTYRSLVAIGFIVVMYSGAFHFVLSNGHNLARFLIPIAVLLATPVVVANWKLLVVPPPVLLWLYGITLIAVVGAFGNPWPVEFVQEVRPSILFAGVFILSYLAFDDPVAKTAALWALTAVVLITVVVVFLDLIVLHNLSTVDGRGASLYTNPNTTAAVLVLGLVLTAKQLSSRRILLAYAVTVGAAVLATQSRSALIVLLAAYALLIMFHRFGVKLDWRIVAVGSIALSLIGALYFLIVEFVISNTEWGDRLAFAWSADTLDDTRVHLLTMAWDKYLENPWFGQSTGIPLFEYGDRLHGPHNMYLSLGIQFGIIGFIFLPLLGTAILRERSRDTIRWTFVIVVSLLALFTHQLFVEWHYAVALALASQLPMTFEHDDHRLVGYQRGQQ